MEKAAIIAALLSTTTISLLPNILLFLFPNYEPGSPMLSIGQALAAGALLGDVFLHTLPHAMMDIQSGGGGGGEEEGGDSRDHGHGHDHGHEDNDSHDHGHIESIGLAILVGFFVFFVFDIFVRSFGSHDHHNHNHNHDHAEKSCSKEEEGGDKKNKKSIFTSAVILNVIGDSLHNFTDGIAIGASFAAASVVSATLNHDHDHDHGHDHHHDHSDTIESSLLNQVLTLVQSRGGLASMAVLFHEIPHELGDFAILVSAGMSKKQAIKTQFSTAIAAYCGTFVGLFGMEYMKNIFEYDLMIPFTAGGFIYLAAVTILPSLLEEKRTLNVRMLQIMAFIAGIAFMYYVAVLEHSGDGCSCCHDHLDLHTGHDHDHHGHDHTNEHHHDHHEHDHHDDDEL